LLSTGEIEARRVNGTLVDSQHVVYCRDAGFHKPQRKRGKKTWDNSFGGAWN
jgi:hypothetical protein